MSCYNSYCTRVSILNIQVISFVLFGTTVSHRGVQNSTPGINTNTTVSKNDKAISPEINSFEGNNKRPFNQNLLGKKAVLSWNNSHLANASVQISRLGLQSWLCICFWLFASFPACLENSASGSLLELATKAIQILRMAWLIKNLSCTLHQAT